jgi:hypothetical protein
MSRLFKNWASAFPPPKNGRALLYEQIPHQTNNPFLWLNLALAIIRWSFRNLIIEPVDLTFQPVLYFSEIDMIRLPHHIRREIPIFLRLVTDQTLSFGVGMHQLNI